MGKTSKQNDFFSFIFGELSVDQLLRYFEMELTHQGQGSVLDSTQMLALSWTIHHRERVLACI